MPHSTPASGLRLNPTFGSIAALCMLATTLHAQWTATSLHPAGAHESVAYAVSGSQIVGYATVTVGPGVRDHACVWTGSAGSWVDIHPGGSATESRALSTDGVNQGGTQTIQFTDRAVKWAGSAASGVSLGPTGSPFSSVNGITGGTQYGFAYVSGTNQACLWTGTVGSWTSLQPAGCSDSMVYAASPGQQAGYAVIGTQYHAARWTGTAGSFVDLHPAGYNASYAYAADGGQQGGVVHPPADVIHACIWSGTAASIVDLHPALADGGSFVYAMSGGKQAGYGNVDGPVHAFFWNGTAASWVDLNDFLPPDYESSIAYGISSSGTTTRVCGQAYNTVLERTEAMLWTLSCSTPTNSLDPLPVTVCPGADTTFTAGAAGAGLAYQWQWKPTPASAFIDVVAGPNVLPSTTIHAFDATGQDATTVHVDNVDGAALGGSAVPFRMIATNSCGSATGNAALLTVQASCCDSIDYNNDGLFPDTQDIDDFISVFAGGACSNDPNCGDIDFNNDGLFPDTLDIDSMLSVFSGGACL